VAARLKELYRSTIRDEMQREFNHNNIMEIPKIEKVVVNMGVGDATAEPRFLEAASAELAQITGQKSAIRKARKSISAFKVREGAKVACMATLRGDRMYEFIDRLFNVVIPRIRDFRGLSPNSFDHHGNYTMGLKEQAIFPEVDIDSIVRPRGMNVTFVIANTRSTEESRALLKKFGMPFRN